MSLTSKQMLLAFSELDLLILREASLTVGGGGAMLLAHNFPLATSDVDAIPKGLSIEELKPFIEQVALKLSLPADWLNPWFSSFTYVLPSDYESRLIQVFQGKNLKIQALGKEDLLIMKCFAHRSKDIPHARALVRAGADLEMVGKHIQKLIDSKIKEASKAADFLDQIVDLETP